MLMLGGLLGPLSFALYANKGQFRLPVRSVGVNLAMGVILMSLASSTFTNLSEGRFIDQNGVVDELVSYALNVSLRNIDLAFTTSQWLRRNHRSSI